MKMRKKSSKKRFKVATTSFLAAVLLSLSLNSSKVYMAEENVEVTTENVNENERNLPEVRTRAAEGDGDDIAVLPKITIIAILKIGLFMSMIIKIIKTINIRINSASVSIE